MVLNLQIMFLILVSDIVVINLGKAESFPWLSQIAANYEEYEIKLLVFCYKSKVSDKSTSSDGHVGSVIMFMML